MTRQVSGAAIIACDPAMCAALAQRGIPSGNLLVLGPGAGDPLGSDVVLGTAAVRALFGGRLAAVYAPEVLASFGTGPARIDVRIVAPDGSAAYRRVLAADRRARRAAGLQLLRDRRLTASPAARAALAAGQVDARLLITLAALAASQPMRVTGFGAPAPGASPGLPLGSAELTAAAGTARRMLAFLRAQRSPYLPVYAAPGRVGADGRVRRTRPARPAPRPIGQTGSVPASLPARRPVQASPAALAFSPLRLSRVRWVAALFWRKGADLGADRRADRTADRPGRPGDFRELRRRVPRR